MEEYRRIDATMSTYKPDSEISRVNAPRPKRRCRSAPSSFVHDRSLAGAVRREPRRVRHHLRQRRLSLRFPRAQAPHRRARSRSTWRGRLPARRARSRARSTVRFKRPACGSTSAASPRATRGARGRDAARAGVEHALLNAGGDTRVIGDRRGQPWIVGIRHPRVADEVVTRLPIVDEAISTSGDYERFFEENGRRYHHIINPATGQPTEGILTVTVIGPDGTHDRRPRHGDLRARRGEGPRADRGLPRVRDHHRRRDGQGVLLEAGSNAPPELRSAAQSGNLRRSAPSTRARASHRGRSA